MDGTAPVHESAPADAAAAIAPAPPPAPLPTRIPHVSPVHLKRLRRLFTLLQALSPALAARVAFWLFLRTFRHPLRPDDKAALARAKPHQVKAGRDIVKVYEWGSGERRVIILHGWGSGAARFTRLAESLQARGWHVLVPDAPGHGASPGRSSSLPQFVTALDAVIARFGAPHALVGHSLGALAIACRYRSGAPSWSRDLSAIALISMPAGAHFLVEVYLEALGIRTVTRARLLELFERRFQARVEHYEAAPGVAHIDARLLFVHDRGDDIVPYAHSEALLRVLPRAQVLTTESLGHSALTREEATVGRVVRFLDGEREAAVV